MSLSNRCHVPLRINKTTVAAGTLEGTQISVGSSTRTEYNNSVLLPNQSIVDLIDRASTLLSSDVYASIVADNGETDSSTTEKSASGWSVNIQLTSSGTALLPADNADLYSTFISGLVGNSLIENRVCGVGMYNWGIHFDQLESRQTGRGDVVTWNSDINNIVSIGVSQGRQRAESGIVAGDGAFLSDGSSGTELDDQAFDFGNELEKQKQTVCNTENNFNRNRSTGGTAVSGAAVGATYSISKNLGLQIPSALTSALDTYELATPIDLNIDIVNLVRDRLSKPQDYDNPEVIYEYSDSLLELLMHTGVKCKLNSLTGRMTGTTAGVLDGNLNNVVSQTILEIATNVLGNGDLSKFCNIFNTAIGAAKSSAGLGQSLSQAQGQVFGNAKSQGSLSLGNVPGFDLDKIAGGKFVDLVGSQESILSNVTKDEPIALFGTAYQDMNSMVTQGFGSLTSDITSLGQDLKTLGRLANLEDLYRIGTPGQIVEQLIVYGATATKSIIAPALVNNGISATTINLAENDSIAENILSSITDPALVENAFSVLLINRSSNISSLSVFTDPDWLFSNSRNSNRFTHLNEMSLHLSILGEMSMQEISQLGDLMYNMETITTDSDIANEIQPITVDENVELKREAVPTSEYSGDNDLVIADFIGTAAGYRVVESLPQAASFIDQLTALGTLDCYTELLQLLKETLNGDRTFGATTFTNPLDPLDTVTLPAGTYLTDPTPATATWADASGGSLPPIVVCGRYTFGYYADEDDALLALHNAVEDELDYIYDNASGDTLEKLLRLQGLHDEVNYQLYKEHKLRKTYGVDIGFSEVGIELFSGTGSKSVFKLLGQPDTSNDPNITVYVGGIKLSSGQFSYDSSEKTVTVTSTPGSSVSVEIIYNTGNSAVTGDIKDIWSFTSSLESLGPETGFGREADFIQRLLSNDKHGSRIRGSLIQGRNKERASTYGLELIDYNRVNSTFNDENPNGVSTFADVTGVWSGDPSRAAEIYLQNHMNVESRQEYVAYQIKKNKNLQQESFDDIMSTVCRKLIFYSGGYIAISNDMSKFYNVYKNSFRNRKFSTSDIFKISLDETYPETGFVVGPYKQIMSEILKNEAINDLIFDTPLTDQTKQYLKAIDVDLKLLTAMIQKIMLVNAGNYLGLLEDDTRNIFNVPGVGKYLLKNIVNQL